MGASITLPLLGRSFSYLRTSIRCCIPLLSILAAGTPAPTFAATEVESLRAGLSKLAVSVKEAIAKQNQNSINIGVFASPVAAIPPGLGINEALGTELKKLKVIVDAKAPFEINGSFENVSPLLGGGSQSYLKIKGTIRDAATGLPLQTIVVQEERNGIGELKNIPVNMGQFEFKTADPASYAAVMPVNAAIPPGSTFKEAGKIVTDAVAKPSVRIEGEKKTRLVALTPHGESSDYAVEILVKDAQGRFQPRAIESPAPSGRPFVQIAKGEAYQVRIYNDSAYDAAVDLRIDGVSCFAFRDTNAPNYDHWIIPKQSQYPIKGWYKNYNDAAEFLVMGFDNSREGRGLSELYKDVAKVGTISLSFSAAWQGGQRPPDEPDNVTRGPEKMTGQGQIVDQPNVNVFRTTGVLRAVLTISYNKP